MPTVLAKRLKLNDRLGARIMTVIQDRHAWTGIIRSDINTEHESRSRIDQSVSRDFNPVDLFPFFDAPSRRVDANADPLFFTVHLNTSVPAECTRAGTLTLGLQVRLSREAQAYHYLCRRSANNPRPCRLRRFSTT